MEQLKASVGVNRMKILNTVRAKPFPETNGDEIVLGQDGRIGHVQVYPWTRKAKDRTHVDMQRLLVGRISCLLKTDEDCQEILAQLDMLYSYD
jgi:hypothetical protein